MTALRDQVPLAGSSPNGQQPGARGTARKGLLGQAAGALRFAGRLAMGPPQAMMQLAPGASLEMLRIALGKSHVEPGKGDHRFADQAWQQNPALRRAMQAYLYLGSSVDDVVDSLGLDGMAAERVRFALIAGPGGHGAHQQFLDQPRGGQALLRHRRPQRLARGRQHGPRHAAQPRHAVDGQPQAVQAGREPRDLARRGHPPIRGLRADPVHAATWHRLRPAAAGDTASGEQVLRAGPLPWPQHVRIPAAARHQCVHHQLAQPDRGAAALGLRHLRAGGDRGDRRHQPGVRLAGRERHGRLPGRDDGRGGAGAPGRAGRAPDQLRDDDRHHARLRLRRADVPVRVAGDARAGQGGLEADAG